MNYKCRKKNPTSNGDGAVAATCCRYFVASIISICNLYTQSHKHTHKHNSIRFAAFHFHTRSSSYLFLFVFFSSFHQFNQSIRQKEERKKLWTTYDHEISSKANVKASLSNVKMFRLSRHTAAISYISHNCKAYVENHLANDSMINKQQRKKEKNKEKKKTQKIHANAITSHKSHSRRKKTNTK